MGTIYAVMLAVKYQQSTTGLWHRSRFSWLWLLWLVLLRRRSGVDREGRQLLGCGGYGNVRPKEYGKLSHAVHHLVPPLHVLGLEFVRQPTAPLFTEAIYVFLSDGDLR